MLYDRSLRIPLSPNLCEQMRLHKVVPGYDQNKEDSWQLGMSLLCAGTNTTTDYYYEWLEPQIKEDLIFDSLSTIKSRYSYELYNFILHCLEFNEESRYSLYDHEKFLRPY